jgi:hypothetical protein
MLSAFAAPDNITNAGICAIMNWTEVAVVARTQARFWVRDLPEPTEHFALRYSAPGMEGLAKRSAQADLITRSNIYTSTLPTRCQNYQFPDAIPNSTNFVELASPDRNLQWQGGWPHEQA